MVSEKQKFLLDFAKTTPARPSGRFVADEGGDCACAQGDAACAFCEITRPGRTGRPAAFAFQNAPGVPTGLGRLLIKRLAA